MPGGYETIFSNPVVIVLKVRILSPAIRQSNRDLTGLVVLTDRALKGSPAVRR
jgi:hypothetical protein